MIAITIDPISPRALERLRKRRESTMRLAYLTLTRGLPAEPDPEDPMRIGETADRRWCAETACERIAGYLVIGRPAAESFVPPARSPLEARLAFVLGDQVPYASYYAIVIRGRDDLAIDLAPPRDPDDVVEMQRRQFAPGTPLPIQLVAERSFAQTPPPKRGMKRLALRAWPRDVPLPERLVALRPGPEPGALAPVVEQRTDAA